MLKLVINDLYVFIFSSFVFKCIAQQSKCYLYKFTNEIFEIERKEPLFFLVCKCVNLYISAVFGISLNVILVLQPGLEQPLLRQPELV